MGKVFFVCFGPKRYRFGIEQKLGVVVVGNEFFPNKFAQTRKNKKQMAMEQYSTTRLVRPHESWWSERILQES